MNYVKQFDILGVDSRQTSCIELKGAPNAATEGAVGVLGIDITSPTRDVYKCVGVNGGVYTWMPISEMPEVKDGENGLSLLTSVEGRSGLSVVTFPFYQLNMPEGYKLKVGDLILDFEGYLYQVILVEKDSCTAKYLDAQFLTHGVMGDNLFGEGNRVYGKHSIAFGKNNEIGLSGEDSIVGGTWSLVNALTGFAFGDSCHTRHHRAIVLGYFNDSSAINQLTTGQYNAPSEDALFVIGNGTSRNNRSNAFEVLKDGTILTPYGSPVHIVSGSFIGSGYSMTLSFDAFPKIIFVNGEASVLTGDTKSVNWNTTVANKVYKYTALCVAEFIRLPDEEFITFTIEEESTGATSSHKAKEGMTWETYIKNIMSDNRNVGVGKSTGRVFWYNDYYIRDGDYATCFYYSYLTDGKGNYVLGTDIITQNAYVTDVEQKTSFPS